MGPTVHLKTYIFRYFTKNIWPYLLWPPVVVYKYLRWHSTTIPWGAEDSTCLVELLHCLTRTNSWLVYSLEKNVFKNALQHLVGVMASHDGVSAQPPEHGSCVHLDRLPGVRHRLLEARSVKTSGKTFSPGTKNIVSYQTAVAPLGGVIEPQHNVIRNSPGRS